MLHIFPYVYWLFLYVLLLSVCWNLLLIFIGLNYYYWVVGFLCITCMPVLCQVCVVLIFPVTHGLSIHFLNGVIYWAEFHLSLMYYCFVRVVWVRGWGSIFPPYGYGIIPAPFVEKTFFSYWTALSPLSKIRQAYLCGCISGPYAFHWYIFIFMPVPTVWFL